MRVAFATVVGKKVCMFYKHVHNLNALIYLIYVNAPFASFVTLEIVNPIRCHMIKQTLHFGYDRYATFWYTSTGISLPERDQHTHPTKVV